MNSNPILLRNQLVTAISCSQERASAVISSPDKPLFYVCKKKLFKVVKLWLLDRGEFWDEETFSGCLLFSRPKSEEDDSRYVRIDANQEPITSSLDDFCDFTCLLICETKKTKGEIITPYCLKARFTQGFGAICFSYDNEVLKMLMLEGSNMKH